MEKRIGILIADENIASRTALRDGLQRAGYHNIEEASNGEDAVGKMLSMRPDVVLLDVWLSKLDGIGVLRKSRTIDWGKDKEPAFIIVSSVSNQNIFIQANLWVHKHFH